MQVQVRVNEVGALRNQRYAFTDKFTLLSELLQNARRAGASQVWIHYDAKEKNLRVVDNGCGIDDFQKLLSFNESGWDEATCEAENPFGIGFSKCLYASSRCVVTSRNRKIDINCVDALEQKPIEVLDAPFQSDTQVELFDVSLPDACAVDKQLRSMCSGFPIPIMFNGSPVLRPHAPGAKSFIDTKVGKLHIGDNNGTGSTDILVFLQGFSVSSPILYDCKTVNVVHLDPRQFVARLPDRTSLVDASDQLARVGNCIREQWRDVLMRAKSCVVAAEFADRYYETMRVWRLLDLLNDVPVLPKAVCLQIAEYPIQERALPKYVKLVDSHVTKSAVESGAVELVTLNSMSRKNAAIWCFARARNLVILDKLLDGGHWVYGHVRDLDRRHAKVVAEDVELRAFLTTRALDCEVVLCNSISIAIGDDKVTLDADGLFHDDSLWIPKNETTGKVVEQADSFIDEDGVYREDDRNEAFDMLAELIQRQRCKDAKETLGWCLRDINLEQYPLLRGRTFQVTVGARADEHQVAMID